MMIHTHATTGGKAHITQAQPAAKAVPVANPTEASAYTPQAGKDY
jgi:hypothetical protein